MKRPFQKCILPPPPPWFMVLNQGSNVQNVLGQAAAMPVSNLRPIYRMRLVVTTCSTQLISCCANANIAPTSIIKKVNKTRLSLRVHVGLASCYYKSHGLNWPLIDFYLVWLSLLKSPALVNDYWTVINTTVTEGSKHFLLGGSFEKHFILLLLPFCFTRIG